MYSKYYNCSKSNESKNWFINEKLGILLICVSLVIPSTLKSQNHSVMSSIGILEDLAKDINEEKTTFMMFGEGNLQDNLAEGKEDANNVSGLIGVNFKKGKTSLGLTFNLADSPNAVDVDSSYLGEALISPNLESLSFALEANHYFSENNDFYLSFYALGTSDSWNINDEKINAGIFSGALKINYMPFHIETEEIGLACLWFDLGFTIKSLFSDIAKDDKKSLRMEYFSTDKTTFYGAELGINLQIGKTLYYAKLPWVAGTDSVNVDGLTGLRLVIGAKVSAEFLKIKQ